MRKPAPLTAERLRETLDYDPATGIFTCRQTRKRAKAGSVAGKLKDGYRRICIDNHNYGASALAWFWVHGCWPKQNLWFVDGNRDNAAIGNLKTGLGSAEYQRNYRKTHRHKTREKRIRHLFGLEQSEYQAMYLAQKGCCAICDQPETATQRGHLMWLCVDHDHATNAIRALLCQQCNKMLGHAKDSVETLTRAISYLQAHAARPAAETNIIPLAGRRATGTNGSEP